MLPEILIDILVGMAIQLPAVMAVSILAPRLFKWEKKGNLQTKKKGVVYLTKPLFLLITAIPPFIAVVGLLLLIFPEACAYVGLDRTLTILLLLGWSIPMMLLIPLFSTNIYYGEDFFVYRGVFWIKKTYSYEDIRETHRGGINGRNFTLVMKDGRRIRLFNAFFGLEGFVNAVRASRLLQIIAEADEEGTSTDEEI